MFSIPIKGTHHKYCGAVFGTESFNVFDQLVTLLISNIGRKLVILILNRCNNVICCCGDDFNSFRTSSAKKENSFGRQNFIL